MQHTVASLVLLSSLLLPSCPLSAAEISEAVYEGREQFVVKTSSCTWMYDRTGGGFSKLIDSAGNDWIQFSKSPLSSFPQSAAAGYRGIPNCVFVGPEKGAGHPGFDKCVSRQDGKNCIISATNSGNWSWKWTFHEHYAEFEMLTAGESPWWFLYEGPPGGKYAPKHSFWGTDTIELSSDVPAKKNQRFGAWQTFYVGSTNNSHLLAIHQVKPDQLTDTNWYLGSENGGAANSSNGMIVVGFGRGPGTKPQITGAGHSFRVGFVPARKKLGHKVILEEIAKRLNSAAVE